MTITRTALAAPTVEKLLALIAGERKVLEQLLFRLTELELLLAGAEHRFIGKALDEIDHVENDLAMYELSRAIVVETLLPPNAAPTANSLLEICTDNPQLSRMMDDLRRLVAAIEHSRERCKRLAGERAHSVGTATHRLETHGFGPYG